MSMSTGQISATVSEALDIGVKYHQAGNLQQAESVYRQILQVAPQNVVALHLLGVIAHQVGQNDQACNYIGQALRLRPDYVEAHSNLGLVLMAQGKVEEAVASLTQAVRLNPRYAEAHNNLGLALQQQGKLDKAIASWQKAIRFNRDYAEAHNNLGLAFQQQGKLKDSVASLTRAVHLNPNYADAHNNLGLSLKRQGKLAEAAASWQAAIRSRPNHAEAHNNLGLVLREQGKLDEAIACLQQAVRLKPDFADGFCNLGGALKEQGKLDDAAACLKQAVLLNPASADAHNNLGLILNDLGKPDEAVTTLQEAIRLKPDNSDAHNNLGLALAEQGNVDRALASLQEAVRLKPDNAEAHKNLGMISLLAGDFKQGWSEYEWRRKCPEHVLPKFRQPVWDGSALNGRTILLHAEQGLGDTLQFIRYAPLIKERGGHVLVACPPALNRLLSGCPGIDRVVSPGALPPFDVYAPLPSLPKIFETSLETIPANVPYLAADAGLIEHWKQELGKQPGFKIGISWQGNPRYSADRRRSIPLLQFAPLSRLAGVQLFSLQKGLGTDQLSALAGRMTVTDLGSKLDEASGPFMDTAALMKTLDLIITSDTATAHLAGALGAPVWVALPVIPDWRWMLGREDSPWYPTMRLFRQTERGNWPQVFERIVREVDKLLSNRPAASHAPPTIQKTVATQSPAIGSDPALSKDLPRVIAPLLIAPPAAPVIAPTVTTPPVAPAPATHHAPPATHVPPPAPAPAAKPITVEVSPGELIDKITILEIKNARLTDAAKLANVRLELATLQAACAQALPPSERLTALTAELRAVNETLWQIEDDIRDCERLADFGPKFIELARAVYRQNDRRAGLKRQINELLGSKLVEEKAYKNYT